MPLAPDAEVADGRLLAVIVTYFPDLSRLIELIGSIRNQVEQCLVIDNGSDADFSRELSVFPDDWLLIRRMGLNHGIAGAQNLGVQHAMEHGFGFVALFDQDSRPAHDMIHRLRQAYEHLVATGMKVAAVGPNFFAAEIGGTSPFVVSSFGWPRRMPCTGAVAQSDHLIASGCLMPTASFAVVGAMNESLFIDYVDIEWGLRAKALGYLCFGVCGAKMVHSLGDGQIRLFGRGIPVRNPLRHYYMVRNALWLVGRRGLPWEWKLMLLVRSLRYYVVYSLFAKPRLDHLRMMSLGVLHALKGRMGRYDL